MRIPSSNTDADLPEPRGLKTSFKWGLVAALMTAVGTFFLPDYYRSEARILPADSKASGGLGQLAAAAAAFGVGVPAASQADANFVDILTSRTVLEDLLNSNFEFRQRSWRFGPEQVHKQRLYDYLEAKNMDRATRELGAMVVTSKDVRSKILSVSVETRSPELSRQILQKALKDLEAFVMEKGRTKGGAEARFAEARLGEARAARAQAEDSFRQFLEGNRNYQTSTDPSVRLQGNRLETELKLKQQLVLTLAVNLEQALLEEKNDIPIINILDEPNLPIDKSRPKRSAFVAAAFFGIFLGVWLRENRRWIRARLLEADPAPELSVATHKESA